MENSEIKILVVDDEEKIVDVVKAYLEKERFQVFTASTGMEAIEKFNKNKPNLIILDLMLPDFSGEEVCKKIRSKSDVPIIMLTAKIANENVVKGFELGADDYVQKPFRTNELVMRVSAILKRFEKSNDNKPEDDLLSFQNGYLKIDYKNYIVKINDEVINLTPSEFKILALLSKNKNRSFTRDQLIEFALDNECQGYDRTIDAFIKNLRQKIEKIPKNPKFIVTVHGIGYRFECNESLVEYD